MYKINITIELHFYNALCSQFIPEQTKERKKEESGMEEAKNCGD